MYQLVREHKDGNIDASIFPTKGALILEIFEALGAGDLFLVDPDPTVVFDSRACEAMKQRLKG